MVQVSKKEIGTIRKLFPELHVKRTVHKYYVEESKALLNFLKTGRRTDG